MFFLINVLFFLRGFIKMYMIKTKSFSIGDKGSGSVCQNAAHGKHLLFCGYKKTSCCSIEQQLACQTICTGHYWCCGRSRSCTTFTGEKVVTGTSTKIVFQHAIAPFHNPGSSCARRSRPPLDFDEMKPVAGSV